MKAFRLAACFSNRVFLALALFFISCDYSYFEIDQLPDYEFSPVLVVPIAHSTLTINDIIAEVGHDAVSIEPDNMVVLVFSDQMSSPFAEDLFVFPDTEFKTDFNLNFELKSTQHRQRFTDGLPLSVNNDMRLDSITFKQGSFVFDFHSPELQAEGAGFSMTMTFPGSRNSQGNPLVLELGLGQKVDLELAGFTFAVSPDEKGINRLLVNYDINLELKNTPKSLSYKISFDYKLKDLKFEKIFGFLGRQTINAGKGNIPLNFFSKLPEGTIEFARPQISLTTHNSFGFPVDLLIGEFVAISPQTSLPVTGFPVPFRIQAPSVNQIGQSVPTQVTLDSENSNLPQLISLFPNQVRYDLGARFNPINDRRQNFALDKSRFSVDLEVIVPMHGLLKGVSLADTLDFSFSNPLDVVHWLELNLDVNNGFPLEASLQVHFLDENNRLLVELFAAAEQQNIIESGILDDQGRVIAPGRKNTRMVLDISQIEDLFRARRIAVSSWMRTTDNGSKMVKLYSDYSLEISLGARLKTGRTISL